MASHTQPVHPNIAPGSADAIPTRICQLCCAKRTTSAYGLNKIGRGGLDNSCKECRAQYLRLKRQEKYGSVSKIDDSHVRIVSIHNKAILNLVFATNEMEFRAFDVVSMAEYKVFFGPSKSLGLKSLTLFAMDGTIFIEWSLSSLTDTLSTLLAYVKLHRLRLELDDMGLANSKTIIYYI